jgi:hypothetical protein
VPCTWLQLLTNTFYLVPIKVTANLRPDSNPTRDMKICVG